MESGEARIDSLIAGLTGELGDRVANLQRSTVLVRSGRIGSGSGVVWRSTGLIVTNAHVARGPSATIELNDGRTVDAEVVARDQRRDLAALVVEERDLPAPSIGDSSQLRVGQLVIAIGNPFGLTGAGSAGIIHAIAPSPEQGPQTWVQADVRLMPGNSGGPLADAHGSVIGINSMVGGGLGLAVPSNDVQRFLRRNVGRPIVGVTLQEVRVPGAVPESDTRGLIVLEVVRQSAAERAGLMMGDIIVGVDGQRIEDHRDVFLQRLTTGSSGALLKLNLIRGGRRISLGLLLPGEVENNRDAAA